MDSGTEISERQTPEHTGTRELFEYLDRGRTAYL